MSFIETTKSKCYALLPHAGLGNKLFIWAQCVLFAKQNNCDYYVTGWYHLHIRTLFKIIFLGKKRHEYYLSPFVTKPFNSIAFLWFNKNKSKFIDQAGCGDILRSSSTDYYFKDMNNDNYFLVLRDHRKTITEIFWASIKKKYLPEDQSMEIGIHIRRGDFVKLGMISPVDYFRDTLKLIRAYVGHPLRAKIYSDGSEEELSDILNEPNTFFHSSSDPMQDLLSLSKSRIVILSANSTFGMWAAFFSEAIIIRTKEDLTKGNIRSQKDSLHLYEGELNKDQGQWPALLKENLNQFVEKTNDGAKVSTRLTFYLNNKEIEKTVDSFFESVYINRLIDALKEEAPETLSLSVYIYIDLDSHKAIVRPLADDRNKKICIIIDEYAKENSEWTKHFDAVFQAYLKEIKSDKKYYHFPLGYSKNLIIKDHIPTSKRRNNVFFSGNLHKGRSQFLKSISWFGFLPFFLSHRIQHLFQVQYDNLWPSSFIRFTNGFGKGLNNEEYSNQLFNTKIVLCPEGISNMESYRLYESIKAGCIVITPRLPVKPFFENIPVYQIENWTQLKTIVKKILNSTPQELDNKQSEVLKWYDQHLSAKAVAKYLLTCLNH